MNTTDIKAQITMMALGRFRNQFFPIRSGRMGAGFVDCAFRDADDGEPLGFGFHGVSIEVHVTDMKCLPIKGCVKSFRYVPVLLIIGIRERDGMTKVIAEGVLAE